MHFRTHPNHTKTHPNWVSFYTFTQKLVWRCIFRPTPWRFSLNYQFIDNFGDAFQDLWNRNLKYATLHVSDNSWDAFLKLSKGKFNKTTSFVFFFSMIKLSFSLKILKKSFHSQSTFTLKNFILVFYNIKRRKRSSNLR